MRRLIDFLKRFQIFLFFVALQIPALYAYFSYLNFPKSQYLQVTGEISGQVLTWENEVTKHLNLSKNNQILQQENIALRKVNPSSYIRISRDVIKIDDTIYKQKYEYIPATIVNATFHKANNYFTLDAGRLQGIETNMGVFSEDGIVGIVHHVSKHFAIVKSLLTNNINIDIMSEKTGVYGIMKWDGINPTLVQMSGVSNDMKVKKWEKIVTRGGSGIFPAGMIVGKIAKIKNVEGEPRWEIDVKLNNDFRKIRSVYVIKNLLRDEQKKLESITELELKDE